MADKRGTGFTMGRRADDGSNRWAEPLTAAVAVMAVLAALGAAYLLVDGADILRSQGEQTIEASDSRGEFLESRSAYGRVEAGDLVSVHVLVTVMPAVERVDLRNIALVIDGPGATTTLNYLGAPANGAYTAEAVRDSDGSFQIDQPLLNRGDLVELELPLKANGWVAGPGQELEIQQRDGQALAANVWKVPHNLGSAKIVQLSLVE